VFKRVLPISICIAIIASCAPRPISIQAQAWRETVVAGIRGNSATIAVYYTVTEAEYQKRIKALDSGKSRAGCIVVPVGSAQERTLAYIGAGTVIKDNYVLTVRHLFVHEEGAIRKVVWMMFDDVDHSVEADIVAISAGEKFYDDYAVLKLKENINRIGAPVAEASPSVGEDVAYVGSLRGSAYFMRFMKATKYQKYLRTDEQSALHLSFLEEFPLVCVYPGGPGDSGGGIFNTRGELVGIMYCGMELGTEGFIFSNPIEMARAFLIANGLEGLLK